MKTKSYFMLAALTLSAAACSNSENEYTGPVEARITAGLAGAQTRAKDNVWNGDHIGVMVTDASSSMKDLYKNVEYSTIDIGTAANFTAETGKGIFFQDAGETVTFAAYAPYQASDANALPGMNSDGFIEVNTNDNNTSDKQATIDFLYASGATASRTSPIVSFTNSNGSDCSFHHKMARLDLVLQVSTNDGFNADQIFDDRNFVTLDGLKHLGTFNVTTGVAAVTSTSEPVDNWHITGCKHNDVENEYTNTYTRTYSLILLPQTTAGPLPLTIYIDGQNYKNTRDITPALEAGYVYTYTITVKKKGLEVGTCTITDWNDGGSQSGDATME